VLDNKNKSKSLITNGVITIVILAILLLSGPLANALKVTLSADKQNVRAGSAGDEGNITFTTWVNLSSLDRYVPIQRIYLNVSGPSPRSFSFDTSGGNIRGMNPSVPKEITVVATPSGGFGSGNYGSGLGYGYDYGTGIPYPFGYGYGYGYGYGAGTSPLNVSYTITLNTTNMYDGNYTATTSVFAAGGSASQEFASTSSVSFVVLPRIFMAQIPGIGANESTSSEMISTPVGNFSYTIAAGPNGTSDVNLSVTIQIKTPTNVSINATTGGLGGGAIPSIYFNYTVDDPTWYDTISYIHIRMYYNQSDIPINVDESTLRPARYLSNITSGTGWVKLECGTCPRTLEMVNDPDGQNRSVILKASGVDTSNDYVWANVTHFSSYGVAGTVTTTTKPPSSGGSGGSGGGGGGGMSGENTSNIDVIEKYDMQISRDALTSYRFTHAKNPIMFVNITGNTSLGMITTSIEVLKNTSTLVKISPEGLVYMNANIWVGTSGFATPKNIKGALIKFRVNNYWMSTNGVLVSDIVLMKWDGKGWINLDTKVISKDDTNSYFEGWTNAFSPFAIVAKKAAGPKPTVTTPNPAGTSKITAIETPEPRNIEKMAKKSLPGFGIILAIAGLMAVVFRKRS
jgi:PGF-pre-PGF domain-containing protein